MEQGVTGSRRFNGLQGLRVIACCAVLVFHITLIGTNHGVWPLPIWYGGMAGVDIFFVLSGFVMLQSADRLASAKAGWQTFLLHRLFRVVPLYWLFTLVFLLFGVGLSATAMHQPYLVRWVLGSLAFWPVRRFPGDNIVSVCPVGWTLVFEMFFYFVVTLALAMRRNTLAVCAVTMLLVAAVSPLSAHVSSASFFLDPIVIEFVFGMLVYRLYRLGYTVPRWAAWPLALLCLLTLGLTYIPRLRFLTYGLPAALLVACTVSVEESFRRMPRWLLFLADATYALYLLHVGVIEGVMRVVRHWPGLGVHTIVLGCSVLSVCLAAALRKWVEAPLNNSLLRRWAPKAA